MRNHFAFHNTFPISIFARKFSPIVVKNCVPIRVIRITPENLTVSFSRMLNWG